MSYSFPGNHIGIFKTAGYEVRKFNYWDERNLTLDWASLKSVLMDAPEGAVFVLHGVAHNPTGCDPTQQQWMEIAAIMKVMMMGVVCSLGLALFVFWVDGVVGKEPLTHPPKTHSETVPGYVVCPSEMSMRFYIVPL